MGHVPGILVVSLCVVQVHAPVIHIFHAWEDVQSGLHLPGLLPRKLIGCPKKDGPQTPGHTWTKYSSLVWDGMGFYSSRFMKLGRLEP